MMYCSQCSGSVHASTVIVAKPASCTLSALEYKVVKHLNFVLKYEARLIRYMVFLSQQNIINRLISHKNYQPNSLMHTCY